MYIIIAGIHIYRNEYIQKSVISHVFEFLSRIEHALSRGIPVLALLGLVILTITGALGVGVGLWV